MCFYFIINCYGIMQVLNTWTFFWQLVLGDCTCSIIILYSLRICCSSNRLQDFLLHIVVFLCNSDSHNIFLGYSLWASFTKVKKKLSEISLRCFLMQISSRRRTTYSESRYLVFVFMSTVESNSSSTYILHWLLVKI